MTPATLECDWCDVPATELRAFHPAGCNADQICAACFSHVFDRGIYTDLPLSDRKPVVTYEALLGFAEEVRDLRPDVVSGRATDPQDDVDDMISADVLRTLQADATALIGKKVKP